MNHVGGVFKVTGDSSCFLRILQCQVTTFYRIYLQKFCSLKYTLLQVVVFN